MCGDWGQVKTSPAVNAASGTQTLGYCYDALNRLTAKLNTSPSSSLCNAASSSMLAAYTYDTRSDIAVNTIGRMTEEKSYVAGTLVSDYSFVTYDALGRITLNTDLVYAPAGTSHSWTYSYDLAGHISSVTPTLPTNNGNVLYYAYDTAGRLASLTFSPVCLPNAVAVATTALATTSTSCSQATKLFTATTYGPVGITNATYGNGFTLYRSYDARERVLSNTVLNSSGTNMFSYGLVYLANNNIQSSSDSINGSWTYGYDTLSRLISAHATAGANSSLAGKFAYQCWQYDAFGNRLFELDSSSACPSTLTTGNSSHWAQYYSSGARNRVQSTDTGNLTYDAAGNVVQDPLNKYVYDQDGRLCAVMNLLTTSAIQYVYDAEGQRIAKGNISHWPTSAATCAAPTASNGFTLTAMYVRGIIGNQYIEYDGQGNFVHEDISDGTNLTATYNTKGLHYQFADWLGSKRLQADSAGLAESRWISDPFGNYMTASNSGTDATERHFTGKERDAESGNDYFEARYYSSAMGRFLSPDWSAKEEPTPYAKLDDPQTLNLYAYVENNPLYRVDPDGHFWEEIKNLWNWGHYVNNAGLNAALQKEAHQARADLSKMHGFTINGKSPAEAANGSNQDVIQADKPAFEYLSNVVNNSKQMIGGLLVVGLVDPAAAEKTAVGLGITGTKAATTVAEKLAIEAAESNPKAGKVLQTTLKDARWPSSAGWVKMESRSPGGIVVHWVRNTITGAVADFKLK